MATFQELSNLVWNVADDVLRGLFKQHEYGDITLPFLVLRRLDCILQQEGRKNRGIELYNQFKDKWKKNKFILFCWVTPTQNTIRRLDVKKFIMF